MKVLQVNVVYRKGSTGKIVYDIHELLARESIHSVVCYGRGAGTIEGNVHKTCSENYAKINKAYSMISGLMYGGCGISTKNLIRIIEKEQPNVVHLHCLNGYFVNIYKLISYLKEKQISTVLTLHAEFMHTGNCVHALECEKWKIGCGDCPRLKTETGSLFFDRTHESWQKMKSAFDGFGDKLVIVSVSPWLMQRAKESPILSAFRHEVVLNGLDTNVFHKMNNPKLKKELGIVEEKIVFHAAPRFDDSPDNIKGGRYVIEIAKRCSDIRFLVAGDYPQGLVVPDNLTLLGRIADQEKLAELYSLADATLLTSEKETFSMVVAESLCCGTPVVGFNAGAPEQITIPQYSDFSEYGNIDVLIKNLQKRIEDSSSKDEISECGQKKYSKFDMARNYLRIYEEMIYARHE